jgi:glycosyltransferase involved in cell wall biosynthesis
VSATLEVVRPGARPEVRRPRVAVLHQGFVPRYRVRFYELLSRRGAIEYVVFHGDPPSGSAHRAAEGPFEFPAVRVRNREIRAAGRWFVFQPVLRRIARGGFDGVVLGDEAKFVSSLALQAVFAARGRPVAIWGAGFEKEESLGRVGSLVKRVGGGLKRRRLGAAAGYLAYTEGGRDAVVAAGMPADRVTVVRNTLDIAEQVDLHAAARRRSPAQVRHELGLERDSVVLLYLGRVYREKRVDDLVGLVRRMRERPDGPRVEAVVIGDGPALADAQAAAAGGDGVHFPGRIDDQRRIADYMRVAAGLVIPGKVGLALNHAFAHGVPVLSRASRLHAPEAEYLRDGHNGLMVEGDEADFERAVERFVASPEQQAELSRGALATRADLSLEAMVAAFDEGVRRALGIGASG